LHGVAPFEQFVTTAVWRIMTPMVQEPSTPSAQPPFNLLFVDAGFGPKNRNQNSAKALCFMALL